MSNVITTDTFIHQQLASAGWAPIHFELVQYLCPGVYGLDKDCRVYQQSAGLLPKKFKAELFEATIEGFGKVLVLSRSPQFLAERMGWVGLDVSEVVEYADKAHIPAVAPTPRTSDALALMYAGIQTKEPPTPCKQCGNLSSSQTCLAARRGELDGAPADYRPDLSWPRRCLSYAPPRIIDDYSAPSDYDRRTGRQRWPEVVAQVEQPLPEEKPEGDTTIAKARDLVASMLKDGPCNASAILAAAEGVGIGPRTVQRAAEVLGVEKMKAGFSDGWVWSLPSEEKVAA